jgi:hypothetical protein
MANHHSFLEGIDATNQDPNYVQFHLTYDHPNEVQMHQTDDLAAVFATADIHEPEDNLADVATMYVHEPVTAILPEPLPPPRRFCRTVWRSLALRLVNLRAANSSPAPQ